MILSLLCLGGFLALICAPGLIAQARAERKLRTVEGEA
jgi:hypothetical protein